jgi:Fe-S-cluster formation regulator IscX/YfhJ
VSRLIGVTPYEFTYDVDPQRVKEMHDKGLKIRLNGFSDDNNSESAIDAAINYDNLGIEPVWNPIDDDSQRILTACMILELANVKFNVDEVEEKSNS